MNFASSDIRSGVQGGSQVSSTSTSSTPSTAAVGVVDPLLDHRPGGTAHRREAVDDLDLRALHLDVVEQAELDDVHPELGILDAAQRLGDVFLRDHGLRLQEPHFLASFSREEVDAVDEADPVAAGAHDERVGARAVGEVADTA